jgi:cell division protein FtsB
MFDWHGPEFVLAIIAMSTIGWIVTTAIRAKYGYPVTDDWGSSVARDGGPDGARAVALLSKENEELKAKLLRLEERTRVLERIATDGGLRLDQQIDALR